MHLYGLKAWLLARAPVLKQVRRMLLPRLLGRVVVLIIFVDIHVGSVELASTSE